MTMKALVEAMLIMSLGTLFCLVMAFYFGKKDNWRARNFVGIVAIVLSCAVVVASLVILIGLMV
ncbi:MAG: hypothetical protein LiPW39_279 [Parcubacteria group bacterium LiPW_39]|nr:MAG: hypothetical protein LiPW39_279 [Parcubacteria group bacterium LiPW_39]